MESVSIIVGVATVVTIVVGVILFVLVAVCCWFCCTENLKRDSDSEVISLREETNNNQPPNTNSPFLNQYNNVSTVPVGSNYIRQDFDIPGRVNCQERFTPIGQLSENKFSTFVVKRVIPSFLKQRMTGHYQFSVVILLNEREFTNMMDLNSMAFIPSDHSGQPILDKTNTLMPQNEKDYGNYITGRPCYECASKDHCMHAEQEIFGTKSTSSISGHSLSPFDLLWRNYVSQNNARPECILLYTWILPCKDCTNTIIRSLRDNSVYESTRVIVAHTIFWINESVDDHTKNKDKLVNRSIIVEQVKYPVHLFPGS